MFYFPTIGVNWGWQQPLPKESGKTEPSGVGQPLNLRAVKCSSKGGPVCAHCPTSHWCKVLIDKHTHLLSYVCIDVSEWKQRVNPLFPRLQMSIEQRNMRKYIFKSKVKTQDNHKTRNERNIYVNIGQTPVNVLGWIVILRKHSLRLTFDCRFQFCLTVQTFCAPAWAF